MPCGFLIRQNSFKRFTDYLLITNVQNTNLWLQERLPALFRKGYVQFAFMFLKIGRLSNSLRKNCAVMLDLLLITSFVVPSQTIVPPLSPPSGPRSMM